nr:G-type lectin S-receptor-like serine/threonine-protein kinase At1g11410 [Populus alba]
MEAEKLFLLFSLLMLHFSSCTSQDSLKTNQTIKEGDLLFSKGNIFALGFFSPGSSTNRYLGIWYHNIPEQTVVWVANRNDPIIGSSGFLFINQYGNLVLYGNDDLKLPVWSANVSVEENDTCVAQLLDSGNFLLIRKRSRKIVWQSFDYPTNILLPGMKLGLDRKLGIDRFLTSWRSAEDPGIGDFSVRINPNGSPQFFVYNGTKPIIRSRPWPWRNQMGLYKCTFVNEPDEKYCVCTVLDDSYLLRSILDHSGHVKALTRRESDGQWKEYWKSPQFQWDYYGHCGAYSTCELANLNEFGCACLPGFEPKYPLEWSARDGSGGCVRKRLHTSSVCQHGEGFVKVENVILPESSAAAWVDMSKSLADCEVQCKRNCSCSAYAIIAIPGNKYGCLTWYNELEDITYAGSESHDLYVRVDAYELADTTRKSNNFREKTMLAILAPSIALLLFLISLSSYLRLKKRAKEVKWIFLLNYEYLPNKSLDSFLFHESRRLLLDWRKRFVIIVGIARGILYLHQDSRLRIIHRDLKCSNILLDAEMNPKISDFGMAKKFEGNQTEDRTRRVVGTYGYMSPEYAVLGNFSVKSDVFSFGVMLLEIVSGKKNNRFYQQDPPLTLIGYVWELWREDKALEIVDPSLNELYHPREALKCIQIGLLCVQEDASDRPSMLAVVFMLSNETEIPSPKQPAFLFRKSENNPDIALDVEDGQCSLNEVTITEIACR